MSPWETKLSPWETKFSSVQERWNDSEQYIWNEFAAGHIEHDYNLSKILPEIDQDEELGTKSLASIARLVLGERKFPLHNAQTYASDADTFDVPREGDLAVGFVLIADDKSNNIFSGELTIEIFMSLVKVGETHITNLANLANLARTPFFESRFMVNFLITKHSVQFRVKSNSIKESDKLHLRVVYAMMPKRSRREFAQRYMICRIPTVSNSYENAHPDVNDQQCLVFAKGMASLMKKSEFLKWSGNIIEDDEIDFIEQRGFNM